MAKQRTYAVWEKRRGRAATQREITTSDRPGRFRALLSYALAHNLKTFECDAVWLKEHS